MQPLSGFRDFYPDTCAKRNYLFARWREVARRFGFVEVDGPILEPTDLFRKKSGGELVGQLYQFLDKGERDISLRPEMTPTLARMIAARERDFKKPVKWFSIGRFFRFERAQRGRLREFYQFNCDIYGEAGAGADAELIALGVAILQDLGFLEQDFVVRLSTRDVWGEFLRKHNIDTEQLPEFLNIIDKIERDAPDAMTNNLKPFGVTMEQVQEFMNQPEEQFATLAPLLENLTARGLRGYVEVDPTIVRGLAYYTGTVFEIFDRQLKGRSLAGGGRYDKLVGLLSDGGVELPAVGFGMGDVPVGLFIDETQAAEASRQAWLQANGSLDVYAVIASEAKRPEALGCVQALRGEGIRVELPLANGVKVGKQFQAAEQLGARFAVVFGEEWPKVKVKRLATREETELTAGELVEWLKGK